MFRSLKKIAPIWSLCPAAFLVLMGMLLMCPAVLEAQNPVETPDLPGEICGNTIDDDGDMLIDCNDVECIGTPDCPVMATITVDNSYVFGFGDVNEITQWHGCFDSIGCGTSGNSAGDILNGSCADLNQYNCNGPERFVLEGPLAGKYIYLICYGDTSATQGALAQFANASSSFTSSVLNSGVGPQWEVFATGIEIANADIQYCDPSDPDFITPSTVNAYISAANNYTYNGVQIPNTASQGGAASPGWVDSNGPIYTTPADANYNPTLAFEGEIPTYDYPFTAATSAPPGTTCTHFDDGDAWMWYNADQDGDGAVDATNPFNSALTVGEYLIFRVGPLDEILPGAQEVNCNDGIDNDGDSLIDCNDPDCFYTLNCYGACWELTGDVNPGNRRDQVGHAVAVSGDVVVVGAPNAEHPNSGVTGQGPGVVHIYKKDAGQWVQSEILFDSLGNNNDHFGWDVDISSSVIVVGAPDWDQSTGKVFVFEPDPMTPGEWIQTAELFSNSQNSGSFFGWSVSTYDDYIAVGEIEPTGGAVDEDRVHLFKKQAGTGSWLPMQTLSNPNSSNDVFGWSVDLDGGILAVGAPEYNRQNGGGSNDGCVWVYQLDALAQWSLIQSPQLLSSAPSSNGDAFGHSVSVFGDTIAVGSPEYTNQSFSEGSVYTFRDFLNQNTASQQNETYQISNPLPSANAGFGEAVSLSSYTLVTGSPGDNLAYVWKNNVYQWTLLQELSNTNSQSKRMGESVCISGNVIVIGDPCDSEGAFDKGRAYIFECADPPPFPPIDFWVTPGGPNDPPTIGWDPTAWPGGPPTPPTAPPVYVIITHDLEVVGTAEWTSGEFPLIDCEVGTYGIHYITGAGEEDPIGGIEVTTCPELSLTIGDPNGDGAINIADAIAMLGYLFGGEPLNCVAAMDVNGDNVADISDAIYELAFLFSGGPGPVGGADCTPDSTPPNPPLECESSGCP